MWKLIGSFVGGIVFTALVGWQMMPSMMFTERQSPFDMEETVARIQQNIQQTGNGWELSGLRNPARAVQKDGGNVLPVLRPLVRLYAAGSIVDLIGFWAVWHLEGGFEGLQRMGMSRAPRRAGGRLSTPDRAQGAVGRRLGL